MENGYTVKARPGVGSVIIDPSGNEVAVYKGKGAKGRAMAAAAAMLPPKRRVRRRGRFVYV